MKNQSAEGFALRSSSAFSERLLLYPASGYRNVGTGAMNNERTNGYSWSASPSSTANGFNLNFNSGNVNPQNNNNRGNGFPVRCLQEFAAARKTAKNELRHNGE